MKTMAFRSATGLRRHSPFPRGFPLLLEAAYLNADDLVARYQDAPFTPAT